MTRRAIVFTALLLTAMILPSAASALVHVARSGETLKLLAERYYGSEKFSMIIRAANGFMHPDDGRLIPGEMVEIPEVTYHRVSADETWEILSDRYLGTPKRGEFLAELNKMKPDDALVQGKIIVVPYQLLYVLAPDENLKMIARSYLGKGFSSKWLRNYNLKKKKKYGRGDALLIPLIAVELTKEERAKLEKKEDVDYSKEDQKAQTIAVAQIAKLRDDFENGRYVQIVANAHRLIGTGRLTEPQQIGVFKFLAFAYVAFGENEQARAAFRKALDLQPGMELSPITTSPKILDAFKEAYELPHSSTQKKDN